MRMLFIGAEISLKNSPEGIVSRALLDGFIGNGAKVDLISPPTRGDVDISGLSNHYVVEIDGGFALNKLKKKITGLEGGGFSKKSCELIDNLDVLDYDLIFLRSDPVSLHEVALHINRKYGLSCICSFGDIGSVNPYIGQGLISGFRRKNLRKIEVGVISNSNIVTQTSSRGVDLYRESGFDTSNFIVLPNPITNSSSAGSSAKIISSDYPEEFLNLYSDVSKAASNHKYNAAFVGSLYGERKPDLMFDFFSRFDDVALHIFGGVRNILYERNGLIYRWMRKQGLDKLRSSARRCGVKNIYIWPFMPMVLVSKLIENNFDALINVDANFSPNPFLSSKVVQYLSYNKPIINFSNVGATTDLLAKAGIEFFVDYLSPFKPYDFEMVLDECRPVVDLSGSYSAMNITGDFFKKIDIVSTARG